MKLLHVAASVLILCPSSSVPADVTADAQGAKRLPYPPLPHGWRVSSEPGVSFEHEDGVRRVRSDGGATAHPLFEEQHLSAGFPQRSAAFRRAFNDVNLWHYAMLNDRARNAAYYRALKAVVTNESVVLDIGSGTSGLLAMMAARLGARRVFTAESNEVLAAIAAETIDRNGLSHRIDAFHCSSFELTVADEEKLGHCTLPERATVIVSEIVSTFLFSEGLLRSTADAKKRLCVQEKRFAGNKNSNSSSSSTSSGSTKSQGCVVIPARARLIAAAVHSPLLLARTYAPKEWNGFDLRPANALRALEGARMVDLSSVPRWRFLTPKVNVLEIDLASPQAEEEEEDREGEASNAEVRNFEDRNQGSSVVSDEKGTSDSVHPLESGPREEPSHTPIDTRENNAHARHHRYTTAGGIASSVQASATSTRTRSNGRRRRKSGRRWSNSDMANHQEAAEELGSYRQSFVVNVTGQCGVAAFVCWWFELDLLGGNHASASTRLDSDPDRQRHNPARQHHWGQACTSSNFRGDAKETSSLPPQQLPTPSASLPRFKGGGYRALDAAGRVAGDEGGNFEGAEVDRFKKRAATGRRGKNDMRGASGRRGGRRGEDIIEVGTEIRTGIATKAAAISNKKTINITSEDNVHDNVHDNDDDAWRSDSVLADWRVCPGDEVVITVAFEASEMWPTPRFDLQLAKNLQRVN